MPLDIPLEMMIGPSISALLGVIKLIELSIKLKNVPDSVRTFIQLVKQVDIDVEHAIRCQMHASKLLANYPDFYAKWISGAINATLGALKDLNDFILKDTQKDLIARLEFLFSSYDKLIDQERMLNYVHSRLLSAINAMHVLIFRAEGMETTPMPLPTPSSSLSPMTLSPMATPPAATPSMPRRQSRHRPGTKESPPANAREQCNPYEILTDYDPISRNGFAGEGNSEAALNAAETKLQWLQQSQESEISELDAMSIKDRA